ncbi:MAG TPA: glycogen-binding domain-containing protein [Longimicrobium sp.]|uniref:glycogen-binding domain-containing protein n=1 Tax=Longimicrobium sp. TaxID=2029185 RepID=UPI002EDA9DCE
MNRALSAVAAALIAFSPAAAQGWTVQAGAGRAVHDPVAARVASTSASLGVGYDGARQWAYLSGGVPVQGEGPGWGAAGFGGWVPVVRAGAAEAGLSAALQGYAFGATGPNEAGRGGSVQLLPTVAWRAGGMTATARSGVSAAVDAISDAAGTRVFLDSDARLAATMADGVEVGAGARLVAGEGGRWPYAGATAEVRRPWGGGWAYGGRWLASDHPDPAAAWGAGLRVRVLRATEVQASVRQEPFDPLYWSTPRRTWSVQLSRSLRRPAPVPGPRIRQGVAVFRMPRAEADSAAPSVVGAFNGWVPVPMQREGDAWVARIPVQPGAYHYAFRTAAGEVVLPPGVQTVDDGFGSRSAVLVVP